MELPFEGAISSYFNESAPDDIRNAIRRAEKGDILNPDYPHSERMARKVYEKEIAALQIELVKMQAWVKSSGARIAMVFEGRDVRMTYFWLEEFRENLNPRGAQVVALPKPSDTEASQWYFQRYIDHLPSGGEIAFFDRSWYNRGVVEKVFGLGVDAQRARIFRQVNPFEAALADDGIHIFKFWLNVGRAEQLRRFMAREKDPLKQWKLSWIDVKGLENWGAYSDAIRETLSASHTDIAPWTVVRSDDKRRARLAVIRTVLHALEYERKDAATLGQIDRDICGGPDIWDG